MLIFSHQKFRVFSFIRLVKKVLNCHFLAPISRICFNPPANDRIPDRTYINIGKKSECKLSPERNKNEIYPRRKRRIKPVTEYLLYPTCSAERGFKDRFRGVGESHRDFVIKYGSILGDVRFRSWSFDPPENSITYISRSWHVTLALRRENQNGLHIRRCKPNQKILKTFIFKVKFHSRYITGW